MRALRICVLAAVICTQVAFGASSVSAKEKSIPLLIIGVGATVNVWDAGAGTGIAPVTRRPPVTLEMANAALNTMCRDNAGGEIVLKSDGETLRAGTSRVLSWPKATGPTRNLIDASGALLAAGYGDYEGSCFTGVTFKKVPLRKFYQLYIDGTEVGTYSYGQLKAEKFMPLVVGEEEFCATNSAGTASPPGALSLC